jgi:hypothetical protein
MGPSFIRVSHFQAKANVVSSDGKRFLIITTAGSRATSPPLTVVTNWLAGLKK